MSSMEHAADRGEKKELRKEHPSGWLYLTQHDAIPILVDALLDLPPNREFNKTELAEHATASHARLSATTLTFCLRSTSSRKSRTRPHVGTRLQTATSFENSSS